MATRPRKKAKTNAPTNSGADNSNNNNNMGVQMQQVLQLLSARTKGEATNEEVEQAVSQILSTAGLAPSTSASASSALKKVPITTNTNATTNATTSSSNITSRVPPQTNVNDEASPKITVDTEDYDDYEDDEQIITNDGDKKTNSLHSSVKNNREENPASITSASATATPTSHTTATPAIRKRGRPPKYPVNEKPNKPTVPSLYSYDHIPLGKQGASMMTTFGDGPDPLPQTVSAALLGARRLLQVTIQDARALRRKAKQQFKLAQESVAKDYKNTRARLQERQQLRSQNLNQDVNIPTKDDSTTNNQKQQPKELADPHMLYRALQGHDKLAYEPKCGFDYDQIKLLFPEEMRAYSRWNQLRCEYASQTDEKKSTSANEGGDNNKNNNAETDETTTENDGMEDDENANTISKGDDIDAGGHLLERAAQFDIRTDRMNQGWYMQFSEHRKGSFLPRLLKHEGDNEWEEQRKNSVRQKKGRPENGIWSNMPAKSARFLHWVGFDPNKGLPPPNEETTHALAFLGYDFVGRIVEKAIFLKNLAKAREQDDEVDETSILLELDPGEQLQESDILMAMEDPDIKPAALYSSVNGSDAPQKPAAQLYFGPGFEDRLEMELEELICGNNKRTDITEEEARIRQEEDKLFAEIAAPPSTNNVVMHLLGKDDTENDEDANLEHDGKVKRVGGSAKKRGRKPKAEDVEKDADPPVAVPVPAGSEKTELKAEDETVNGNGDAPALNDREQTEGKSPSEPGRKPKAEQNGDSLNDIPMEQKSNAHIIPDNLIVVSSTESREVVDAANNSPISGGDTRKVRAVVIRENPLSK